MEGCTRASRAAKQEGRSRVLGGAAERPPEAAPSRSPSPEETPPEERPPEEAPSRSPTLEERPPEERPPEEAPSRSPTPEGAGGPGVGRMRSPH